MRSLKGFFTTLFLCGLIVSSCYAAPEGPPDSDETGPAGPPPPPPPPAETSDSVSDKD
jgi:hypothetical protein